ncbi:MSMEG_6728 family protein [Nonomuraea sp. NPDC049158]|uniref:MSMEG_6728 family protein n=1 Tax=Nonomuraea sp. NPDC049158 TaxID=3155649 RepID=UPI00340770C4
MQTFLPYPDFARTAAVLDPLRLGKQRVEALQILRALTIPGYGWRHHPAVRMWASYEEALVRSALLRKEPGFYRPLFGDEPDDLDYVWPASGRPPSCLPGSQVT